MVNFENIANLRQYLCQARLEGKSIALVPTMGNLHEGHLQLVDRARKEAELVVASIFINPLQFGPGEDYKGYPRSFSQDQEKLQKRGCHILFAPQIENMYPETRISATVVKVPHLSHTHCGASRPGHFTGVATVVTKLFGIVQPDVAIFGLKDYQQFLVIKQATDELCLPVKIIGSPIARTENGLAMSSRNGYLNAAQKEQAAGLYRTLVATRLAIEGGNFDYDALAVKASHQLEQAGFQPDYFSICRQKDLQPATIKDRDVVILAAAYLGKARLIDNIRFTINLALSKYGDHDV
jgi:pantoate--beta-alanine ligase